MRFPNPKFKEFPIYLSALRVSDSEFQYVPIRFRHQNNKELSKIAGVAAIVSLVSWSAPQLQRKILGLRNLMAGNDCAFLKSRTDRTQLHIDPNTANVDPPSTLSWLQLSILAPRPKKVQGAFTSLGQRQKCWCTLLGVGLGRSSKGWLNQMGRRPTDWWVWGSNPSNVSQKRIWFAVATSACSPTKEFNLRPHNHHPSCPSSISELHKASYQTHSTLWPQSHPGASQTPNTVPNSSHFQLP